MLVLM